MREEYLAEEMNERDDLFEDIPDDELEEVEREARELRSWFENPDMWAGKSVHDYMEDGWSEDHWYEEDEDIDDSDVDIFTDEFDYDDASLLNLISEEPEEMFEEEDDETLWKSDEEDVVEMDLDDPDVFAFLYMFYMEHADCTGCKMQEGDEI